MLVNTVSQILADVPVFYPPLPEGPGSGGDVIYGMGVAGLWLLGTVFFLVAMTIILPKVFSPPKKPGHT